MQIPARTTRLVNERRAELLGKANVVGMGVGEKETDGHKTGRLSITVFVRSKLPDRDLIPPTIEDVPTDVVEVGELVVQANTTRLRPAIAGISVAHPEVTAGTIGGLLHSEADNRQYLLSCNHVLAASNLAAFGDDTLQPGPRDGGQAPGDSLGTLFRFPSVDRSGAANQVDCALAVPNAASGVDGVTLDAWSGLKQIPGWFGAQNQGGGVAVADVNGSGRPERRRGHRRQRQP